MIADKILNTGFLTGDIQTSFSAIVCDGVGGEQCGEIASFAVAASFISKKFSKPLYDIIRHILSENDRILDIQKKSPDCHMATTLAGLYFYNDKYIAFNLGDSRIYKIKGNELTCLSKDHTKAQQLVNECVIKSVDEASDTDKKTLTSYIGGYGNHCEPSFAIRYICNDERFLLCSDGIYSAVDNGTIANLLNVRNCIEVAALSLIESALKNGSDDDQSVIVLETL